jgi:phage virion morphogenesis protein
MAVTVDIIGLESLLDRVSTLQSDLADTRDLNQRVADVMLPLVRARFDSKKAPSGAAWQAWAPSTAKERAATPGASLLVLTGALRDSLYATATEDGVEIGLHAAYASFHETGTSKMPARPILADGDHLGHDDETAILAALEDRLNELARAL